MRGQKKSPPVCGGRQRGQDGFVHENRNYHTTDSGILQGGEGA